MRRTSGGVLPVELVLPPEPEVGRDVEADWVGEEGDAWGVEVDGSIGGEIVEAAA